MSNMLPNAKNAQRVLNEPFDIKTHKLTFINYLEVVISPDGTVEYAVPSHQEKLLRVFMEQEHISSKQEAFRLVEEQDTTMDGPTITLTRLTGYISVWSETYICGKSPTKKQLAALRLLKLNGLYSGTLEDLYVKKQELLKSFREMFEENGKGAGNDTGTDNN